MITFDDRPPDRVVAEVNDDRQREWQCNYHRRQLVKDCAKRQVSAEHQNDDADRRQIDGTDNGD